MRKFLSLLLVCMMVVPFGMLAGVSVSADTKTVYLSDGGAGDGSAQDKPVGTMDAAYQALGDQGGTIVIVGTYTQSANFKGIPHTGKITIKGADASAVYATSANVRFVLNGPTEFDSLSFQLGSKKSFYVLCLFNDITITETVTMQRSAKTLLNLGAQAHAPEGWNDYTPKDTVANICGGDWEEVIGMVRNGRSVSSGEDMKPVEAFKDVDLTINVDKNAKVGKIFAFTRTGGTSSVFVAENATMTINLLGGAVTGFIGVHDYTNSAAGFGGGMTVNMGKDFDLSKSFNDTPATGVFGGISGDSAWTNETIVDLDTSVLNIAAEIYDSVKDSSKIRSDSFASVNKAESPTDPETPGVTPDPEQPVDPDPEQPGEPTPGNPDTGDMTVVFVALAVMALSLASVVVLKKREN